MPVMTDTEIIPVIDLGPYLAGAPGAVDRTAEELRFALTEIGFYCIVNHGVPSGQIREVFRQAARFHTQPATPQLPGPTPDPGGECVTGAAARPCIAGHGGRGACRERPAPSPAGDRTDRERVGRQLRSGARTADRAEGARGASGARRLRDRPLQPASPTETALR